MLYDKKVIDQKIERLCNVIDLTLPLMLEEASAIVEVEYEDMTKKLAESIKNIIHVEFPVLSQEKITKKRSQNPYSKVPLEVARNDANRGIELAQEYLVEVGERAAKVGGK